MKRAKVMLMAIAVFAIVGGALAFKAKKYAVFYCTGTTLNNSPSKCPNFLEGQINNEVDFKYYRTSKSDGTPIQSATDCSSNLDCTSSARLEEQP